MRVLANLARVVPVRPLHREQIVETVADQVAKIRLRFMDRAIQQYVGVHYRSEQDQQALLEILRAYVFQNRDIYSLFRRMFRELNPDWSEDSIRDLASATGQNAYGGLRQFERAYEELVQTDPTQSKKYLAWILRWYWKLFDAVVGQLDIHSAIHRPLEDAPKLFEYLSVLARGKVPGFDINSITELPELYEVVRAHLDRTGFAVLTPSQQAQIDAQTEYRYSGPEGKIVIPRTEAAAQFWGRGTQWCTSWRKKCMFADYNERGPLYIFVLADGSRYQLHLADNQFMDQTDTPVSPPGFQHDHPWARAALNVTLADVDAMNKPESRHTSWEPELNRIDLPSQAMAGLAQWAPKPVQDWVIHQQPSLVLNWSVQGRNDEADYYRILQQAFARALEVAQSNLDGPETEAAASLMDRIVDRANQMGIMAKHMWNTYQDFYKVYNQHVDTRMRGRLNRWGPD